MRRSETMKCLVCGDDMHYNKYDDGFSCEAPGCSLNGYNAPALYINAIMQTIDLQAYAFEQYQASLLSKQKECDAKQTLVDKVLGATALLQGGRYKEGITLSPEHADAINYLLEAIDEIEDMNGGK